MAWPMTRNIEAAVETILNAVRTTQNVLADPAPDTGVVELAGSSINIRARWWTEPLDAYSTRQPDPPEGARVPQLLVTAMQTR